LRLRGPIDERRPIVGQRNQTLKERSILPDKLMALVSIAWRKGDAGWPSATIRDLK
jgi:hypothetical protein